jgi:hypothetical protein
VKRTTRHRWMAGLVGLASVPAMTLIADGGVAQAVTGYHTSAAGVRVRQGPSTQTGIVNTIAAAGTAIDIACQVGGQQVTASGFGTSTVWDQLNGWNGYISDLFVRETLYGAFDSRIPKCGAPAPSSPAPAAPGFRVSSLTATHSAPTFNPSTATGSIAVGTAVSIGCQNYGTKAGGSFVWDNVPGRGFISDANVIGTPFNAFDPAIPRCTGLNFQPVDCSKTLFLGARGSGDGFGPENVGTAGSPVQVTRNLLAARGANLDVSGTIYPAQSVDQLKVGGVGGLAAYIQGENQGVAVMLANLRDRTDGNVCGVENTRSILVGYSQGAMVVSDAIFQMTTRERQTIVGVVTYGNPYYHQGVNGGQGSSGLPVTLQARGPYPDGVNALSKDYCRQDIVCKFGGNLAEHSNYVTPGPDVAEGAAFLAGRLGL